MGRLDGKVAIITGGASGIGEGTVKLFVGHGAKVVIADVQDQAGERIARELGENVVYQHTDVSKEADIEAMINLAVSKFGRLDCLFNNAGFGGVSGEIDQIELGADYDATIGVMFTGVMLGMKHAAKIMKQQKSGSIISTASVAAIQGGLGPHVYSGIKAGVIGLTQSVALSSPLLASESTLFAQVVSPHRSLRPCWKSYQAVTMKIPRQECGQFWRQPRRSAAPVNPMTLATWRYFLPVMIQPL